MTTDLEHHLKGIKELQDLMKKALSAGGYSRKEEKAQLNRLARQLAEEEEMLAAGEVEDTRHRDMLVREMALLPRHWEVKRWRAARVLEAWEKAVEEGEAEMRAMEEEPP